MNELREFSLETSPLEGINLIDASAGTGKTYTIEGIYLRLVVERTIPVENILVVTYTETATAELKGRILRKLRQGLDVLCDESESGLKGAAAGDPLLQFLLQRQNEQSPERIQTVRNRLRHAIDTFDDAAIYTIHGFCRRTLDDFAFESGLAFDTEIVTTVEPFVEEIAADYWRTLFYNRSQKSTVLLRDSYPSPDEFLRLFLSAGPCPHIQTIPPPENFDMERELARFDALFSELVRLWNESKESIKKLLYESPALDRKKYRQSYLPSRLSALQELFGEYRFDAKRLKWFFQSEIDASNKKGASPPRHPFFEKIEHFEERFSRLATAIKSHFLHVGRPKLKERLESLQLQSFNDLLTNLHSSLTEKRGELFRSKIAERYRAALVDEFQDTDSIQYRIFYLLFGKGEMPVFFIGDPKQSIYQFRGSDIHTYGRAKRTIKGSENGRSYTLRTNYRSDRRLTQAVNAVFRHGKNPFLHPDIEYFDSENIEEGPGVWLRGEPVSPLQIRFLKQSGKVPVGILAAEQAIAESCGSEIVEMLNLGENCTIGRDAIRPQDICVLVRTHRQAIRMRKALASRNVPCILQTRENIFDSEEFLELSILLRGIAFCNSARLVKRSLVTSIFAQTGDDIVSLEKSDADWEVAVRQLDRYRTVWRQRGVYPMLMTLFKERGVRERVLNLDGGERKLTNLLHSVELFHAEEKDNGLGPGGLLAWARRINEAKERPEEQEIRLEREEGALKILTVHAAKGLEFPIVFCPFSWKPSRAREAIFHREEGTYYDLGSPSFQTNLESACQEALAESIRLLYVALTRAKHLVYLYWGAVKKTETSPIAHVLHGGCLENLWSDLTLLARKSEGNIRLSEMPAGSVESYRPRKSDRPELRCKILRKTPHPEWILSSYSTLAKSVVPDREEKDRDYLVGRPVVERGSKVAPIFRLPRGAHTGNCLHEIFENLDLTERDTKRIETLVASKLKKYAIENEWNETVVKMVTDTLDLPLKAGIRLSRIPAEDRQTEMEFFFPLENGNPEKLQKCLADAASDAEERSIAESMGRMDRKSLVGMMRGFIDLVFRWNGRYYILDWKTNHLGDRHEDYSAGNLARYMIRQTYCLQSYIYTLALHKYLQSRLAGYRYERHIGGVFYLFLRGVVSGGDTGVYYKPIHRHFEFVRLLDSYFFPHDQN